MRKIVAILGLCIVCVAGSYLTAIDFAFGPTLICAPPYLVMAVGIALFIAIRFGRIHRLTQRLGIAMLAGVIMLGSFQVFSYQVFLYSSWKRIVATLESTINLQESNWSSGALRRRWDGIISESTTQEEAYHLLNEAIFQSTGVYGIPGFTVYIYNYAIFDNLTFQDWSAFRTGVASPYWIEYLWQPLLTVFGCFTVVAIFSEKRKFKRGKFISRFNPRFLFNIEPVWPDARHSKSVVQQVRSSQSYIPSNVRHNTEEDTPYSI